MNSAASVSEALRSTTLHLLTGARPALDLLFMVLVDPSERRSGATVLNDGGGNTILLMHEWRRRARFFVDRVSCVDATTVAEIRTVRRSRTRVSSGTRHGMVAPGRTPWTSKYSARGPNRP